MDIQIVKPTLPRISIAVPIYNVEPYIERCVRSLFEQTYPNIEFIFVDDCSPDRSLDILKCAIKDYPEREKDIKIVRHEKNLGLAYARNDAVENCTSDFIVHVDSDDWIEKDMIKLMVDKQQGTGADIVSVGSIVHVNKQTINSKEPEHSNSHSMVLALLKPIQSVHIWGRLIRKSLYEEHHIKAIEGINIGEDWQVIPKLAYYSKRVVVVNKCLYHYNRENENSYLGVWQSTFRNDFCRQDIQTIDELKSFFADKDKCFYNALLSIELREVQNYMNLCLKHNDRQFFNELAQHINYENKHLWHILGKHYKFVIILKRNYHLHKIYYNLRGLMLSLNCILPVRPN